MDTTCFNLVVGTISGVVILEVIIFVSLRILCYNRFTGKSEEDETTIDKSSGKQNTSDYQPHQNRTPQRDRAGLQQKKVSLPAVLEMETKFSSNTPNMPGKPGTVNIEVIGESETDPEIRRHNSECNIYKMDHRHRGYAVIFNQKNFESAQNSRREGTDKDVFQLTNVLHEKYGFTVLTFCDYDAEEMRKTLYGVSQFDHSQSDCFFCVFLSHGDDGLVWAKDSPINLQQLFDFFRGERCPTLLRKPKIFVVQACRGSREEVPVRVKDGPANNKAKHNVSSIPKSTSAAISGGADFLVAYATIPGFVSWRFREDGTLYIQALGQVMNINENADKDVIEMLTEVNCKLANNDKGRQTSCFSSMLTKKIIFTRRPKVQLPHIYDWTQNVLKLSETEYIASDLFDKIFQCIPLIRKVYAYDSFKLNVEGKLAQMIEATERDKVTTDLIVIVVPDESTFLKQEKDGEKFEDQCAKNDFKGKVLETIKLKESRKQFDAKKEAVSRILFVLRWKSSIAKNSDEIKVYKNIEKLVEDALFPENEKTFADDCLNQLDEFFARDNLKLLDHGNDEKKQVVVDILERVRLIIQLGVEKNYLVLLAVIDERKWTNSNQEQNNSLKKEVQKKITEAIGKAKRKLQPLKHVQVESVYVLPELFNE